MSPPRKCCLTCEQINIVTFIHRSKTRLQSIQEDPPTLDRDGGTFKYSRAFKEVIDSCLIKDPAKRPTAEQLLQTPFFKSAKKPSYLVAAILSRFVFARCFLLLIYEPFRGLAAPYPASRASGHRLSPNPPHSRILGFRDDHPHPHHIRVLAAPPR